MKRVILVLLIIFFHIFHILSCLGQHEIQVHLGGGLSTLNYTIESSIEGSNLGEYNNGFGFQLGACYRYHLNRNWSGLSGIEFGMYDAKYTMNDDFRTQSTVTDGFHNNEAFEFRSVLKDYNEEKQDEASVRFTNAAEFAIRLH